VCRRIEGHAHADGHIAMKHYDTFHELTACQYGGFSYDCRTRIHPAPVLAPVVLVAGAFQHKDAWGRLEEALGEATTVITVDLPGWGGADLLPAGYDMAFLARALDHALDAAGHREVHVFGGSYGGAIAFRFAQLYPARVLSLALMGTAARIAEPLRSRLLHTISLLRAGQYAEFAQYSTRLILSQNAAAPIARATAVRRILHAVFAGISEEHALKYIEHTLRLLRQDLHSPDPLVDLPVLLGTGEHDDFTTPASCRSVAAHCTDARFTLLRHADHAVHLEVPDQLADLLLRFFTGHPLEGLEYCHPVQYYGTVPTINQAGGTGLLISS
jgi:pimeloyl-ACP methyl ester carboxylesterase